MGAITWRRKSRGERPSPTRWTRAEDLRKTNTIPARYGSRWAWKIHHDVSLTCSVVFLAVPKLVSGPSQVREIRVGALIEKKSPPGTIALVMGWNRSWFANTQNHWNNLIHILLLALIRGLSAPLCVLVLLALIQVGFWRLSWETNKHLVSHFFAIRGLRAGGLGHWALSSLSFACYFCP